MTINNSAINSLFRALKTLKVKGVAFRLSAPLLCVSPLCVQAQRYGFQPTTNRQDR